MGYPFVGQSHTNLHADLWSVENSIEEESPYFHTPIHCAHTPILSGHTPLLNPHPRIAEAASVSELTMVNG